MSSKKLFFKNVAVCLIAVSIPLFLVINSIQAIRCALLEKQDFNNRNQCIGRS